MLYLGVILTLIKVLMLPQVSSESVNGYLLKSFANMPSISLSLIPECLGSPGCGVPPVIRASCSSQVASLDCQPVVSIVN